MCILFTISCIKLVSWELLFLQLWSIITESGLSRKLRYWTSTLIMIFWQQLSWLFQPFSLLLFFYPKSYVVSFRSPHFSPILFAFSPFFVIFLLFPPLVCSLVFPSLSHPFSSPSPPLVHTRARVCVCVFPHFMFVWVS